MADEPQDTGLPENAVKSDIRSTAIVPASHKEATKLARIASGELPANRGLFWCMTCGFVDESGVSKYPKGLTLDFDQDELEALGGDPYAHSGPCPVCHKETLVDMVMMGGAEFSIRGQASKNRKQEYGEAADVFIGKLKDSVGSIMTGGVVPGSTFSEPNPTAGPSREHLPDADDVDVSKMKPREG